MPIDARMRFSLRRNEPRTFVIRVIGLTAATLTAASPRMQIRETLDASGAPLVELGLVTDPAAKGIRIVEQVAEADVPSALLCVQIDKATASDPDMFPYGALGEAKPFVYGLQWGGITRLHGIIEVLGSAIDCENAPTDRGLVADEYTTTTLLDHGASITIVSDEILEIVIDGASETERNKVQTEAAALTAKNEADRAAASAAQLGDIYQQVDYLPGVGLVRAIGGTVTEIIPATGPRDYPSAPLSRRSIDGFREDSIPGVAHVVEGEGGGLLSVRMVDGRTLQLSGVLDGLPAGGSDNAVLLRDLSSPARARWSSLALALAPVLAPILAMLPSNLLRTATPAPAVGYTAGAKTGYPVVCIGRGSAVDKLAVGMCRTDGAQVVRIYNRGTGLLEEEIVVQSGRLKDDHNAPSVACFDDGTFAMYASRGHNGTTYSGLRFRRPDGSVTAAQVFTHGDVTCWPGCFVDRNGKLWLLIRVGNTSWTLRTADTMAAALAGTFSAERTYLTHGAQVYSHQRYDRSQHCFHLFTRVNSTDPAYGSVKRMRLDCATGELSDANGPLGRLDGTASGNGKSLPVTFASVPVLLPLSDGKTWNVSDFSDDGRTLMVTNMPVGGSTGEDDADGLVTGVWRLRDGQNPYVLASYDRFDNVLSRAGTLGTFRYAVETHIAQEPHAGFRFYAAIAPQNGRPARIERWDCPGGDGVTWTVTVLAVGAPGELFARPISMPEANGSTPVMFAVFATFDRYDQFTGEEVRFARGDF